MRLLCWFPLPKYNLVTWTQPSVIFPSIPLTMNVHRINLLATCLTLLGVVVRPSPYRWILFPLIVGFISYFFTMIVEQGQTVTTPEATILLQTVFNASYLILLTDVQRELRLVGQRESITNSGFLARLKWGFQLLFSGRGVGWTHEPRSVIPPHPTLSRFQFVLSRLGWLIAYLLINDGVIFFVKQNPFLVKGAPPFATQPFPLRLWSTVLFATSMSVRMSIIHFVLSIMFVGSGLSDPDLWPHLFGKLSDAYTIRRFWGCVNFLGSVTHVLITFLFRRTWHQLFRLVSTRHPTLTI